MANACLPDAFHDLVAHHLPPGKAVGPQGGRPPIRHRIALKVIWFVLASGCRWEDVPREMGCSGRTAHRRLRLGEDPGVWGRLHAGPLRLLRPNDQLDPDLVIVGGVIGRAFGGGELTGPSPVGRAKKGSKHTPLVDRHGTPLAIHTAGANASDHKQIIPIVLDFPHAGGKVGRPKQRPDELYADAGHDSEATRWLLRRLGIEPKIDKRRSAHGSGLGEVRRVVERTISWLKGLRRMRIRYDRPGATQEAWNTLAAGVICFRIWDRDLAVA